MKAYHLIGEDNYTYNMIYIYILNMNIFDLQCICIRVSYTYNIIDSMGIQLMGQWDTMDLEKLQRPFVCEVTFECRLRSTCKKHAMP